MPPRQWCCSGSANSQEIVPRATNELLSLGNLKALNVLLQKAPVKVGWSGNIQFNCLPCPGQTTESPQPEAENGNRRRGRSPPSPSAGCQGSQLQSLMPYQGTGCCHTYLTTKAILFNFPTPPENLGLARGTMFSAAFCLGAAPESQTLCQPGSSNGSQERCISTT